MVYRWVGAECGLRKTEKIFSANNEQRTIKVVSRKFLKKNFGPSHSRYVPLKAGLPHPSSCCKGEAFLPRLHYKGETSSPKWCIEG